VLRKHPWPTALAIGAVALVVYYALVPVVHPVISEVCRRGDYGPPNHCEKHDVVTSAITWLLWRADEHNGVVAAFAGLAVAFFTMVLWKSTEKLWAAGEKQAELSREIFEAEHRPWLAIEEPVPIGDLIVSNGNVDVSMRLPLRNTGGAPALSCIVVGKLTSYSRMMSYNAVVDSVIEEYRKYVDSYVAKDLPTTVFFPGEDEVERHFIGEFADFLVEKKTGTSIFDPLIIVVACYRSPHDKTIRHTSRAWALSKAAKLNLFSKDSQVAAEDLRVGNTPLQQRAN
jgi:hypothetical protein